MIRTFFVVALVAAAQLMGPAQAPAQQALAKQPDLAGTYRCEGLNPEGKTYEGTVEISKQEQTYRLKWMTPPAGVSVGIGIVKGDVLAVSYFDGAMMGVVLYKIEKGPKLVGEWTVIGTEGHVYPETLTKLGREVRLPLPSSAPSVGHVALAR